MAKKSSIPIQGHYKLQSKFNSGPVSGYYTLQSKFSSEPIRGFYEVGKLSSIPVRGYYKLDSDVGKRTSPKIRGFYELINNNYFPSMIPDSNNEPSSEPIGDEFRGHMYFKASIVCPELGTEYEIPPQDLLGPLEISDGNNTPIKWGFRLLNNEMQYTKNTGDFADLITEGYISYLRDTTKFIKLEVLSVCGEVYEIETFPYLVIKKVIPGARGDVILNLSGTDFFSECLYQSKDWPSYVIEVSCERMKPDELPTWQPNTAYKVGDIIQPPASWSWNTSKTFTTGMNQSYTIPTGAAKLGNIPTFQLEYSTASGKAYVYCKLNFTQDGVEMVVYPTNLIPQLNTEIVYSYENLSSGDIEPATYNSETIMFFSLWAYPKDSTRAFRCTQAGTSGSQTPDWKPFSLNYSKDESGKYGKLAWLDENIEGDVIKEGNLDTYGLNSNNLSNWGVNPPAILKMLGTGDITTDGTCQWEVYSNEVEPCYLATDLTQKKYNQYLGSQVYVNWTEKFPPGDFIPDATTGILNFTEDFSKDFGVNFINPLAIKWLVNNVIQKAIEEAFSYSKISEPTWKLRLDFKDFLFYNNIQVQGKQAIDLIAQALTAFGGQFNIVSYDGDVLTFHVTLTPLYTEIKNQRADFVIPEILLRDCQPADENFDRINTINVIRPGKVRQVRTQVA